MTVPNLSEHLSSAETTAQLSARFGYAAAMKSINNLLLLGDGETWNRQKVDFAGLPEMVRTFLQVAAGAADFPVTRLLGQSPAGLSATGESDTRNYYDMVSARQEADLRPKLERLDRLIARSEGIEADALTFDFRPLWQLDAATAATVALQKAQATQVYAGLNLWPVATTARLVQAQLAEDGTYPNAAAAFGGSATSPAAPTLDFDPDQPRDDRGRWTAGGESGGAAAETAAAGKPGAAPTSSHRAKAASEAPGGILGFLNALNPIGIAQAQEIEPEEENRRPGEPGESEPGDALLLQRYDAAWEALRAIDPSNRNLETMEPPGSIPTEADIARVEAAARDASIARTCDFLRPGGQPIGEEGTSPHIRELPGGLPMALRDFYDLRVGGKDVPFAKGSMVRLPYGGGTVTFRPVSSTDGSPAIDVNIPDVIRMKLHY